MAFGNVVVTIDAQKRSCQWTCVSRPLSFPVCCFYGCISWSLVVHPSSYYIPATAMLGKLRRSPGELLTSEWGRVDVSPKLMLVMFSEYFSIASQCVGLVLHDRLSMSLYDLFRKRFGRR